MSYTRWSHTRLIVMIIIMIVMFRFLFKKGLKIKVFAKNKRFLNFAPNLWFLCVQNQCLINLTRRWSSEIEEDIELRQHLFRSSHPNKSYDLWAHHWVMQAHRHECTSHHLQAITGVAARLCHKSYDNHSKPPLDYKNYCAYNQPFYYHFGLS